ncbi:septation ring formation regulator EzrA [Bacillus mojavensis]|uniref:septation ring formation regulator EzrA n=1 Tax=Bacillus mojavensis TaxID=72360 RepID=UPI002281764F|nr:septation ring formation regulator EzrA [Bacillus mojavensis]MCY9091876.1 septation ring formation regulator EzrA [Bacillus mojavensis]MEC1800122.1 septation ring formation regulator EzrA [Bacillus mojavensis]
MEFVIGLLIVLLALFAAGYFFRKKIYTEIDRLESWKIEILNRSIVEEMSKIKHLKMTGQTEEFFEKWREEWDEIVTAHMPKVEELLYDAEECADKYRFKKANQVLIHIDDLLTAAESNIEKILREISNLVTSEEKSREEIEQVRERYSKSRKNLLAYSHLYGELYDSLEADLDEIWSGIKQFEEETEGGNYITARKVLLEQVRNLERLQSYIDDVPKLLADCKQTLPGQIAKLKDGYREMKEKGYKLEHIQIDKELENLSNQLKRAEHVLMTELDIDEASAILQLIDENIQSVYQQLEGEVEAGQSVLSKMPELIIAYDKLKEEKEQTKAETELVKESYRLTAGELGKQQAFEKRIDEVGKLLASVKDKLDAEHVAYSLLVEEVASIEKQIEEVKKDHADYREKLQALRKEELQARETLSNLKKTISETARLLKISNIPGIPSHIQEMLENAHHHIQETVNQLNEIPLNMEEAGAHLKEAEDIVNRASRESEELVEQVMLIEKIIQFGNRFRSQNHILSEQLKEAERRFYAYDYEQSYEIAAAAVEKAAPGAVKKIKADLSA